MVVPCSQTLVKSPREARENQANADCRKDTQLWSVVSGRDCEKTEPRVTKLTQACTADDQNVFSLDECDHIGFSS